MGGRTSTAAWVAGACVVVGLVSGCDPSPTSSASSAPTSTGQPSVVADTAPVVAAPASAATTETAAGTVRVLRVIDGDTFVVAGGHHIRVLGIDSCEAATPSGRQATAAAQARLAGTTVVLTAERGVDRDRFGRDLRYVATDAGDFGEYMVAADHTAVYQGGNDASPARLARLRSLDGNGRSCGAPEPARTTTAAGAAPGCSAGGLVRELHRRPRRRRGPPARRRARLQQQARPRRRRCRLRVMRVLGASGVVLPWAPARPSA
jgi:micrococcal nuclease